MYSILTYSRGTRGACRRRRTFRGKPLTYRRNNPRSPTFFFVFVFSQFFFPLISPRSISSVLHFLPLFFCVEKAIVRILCSECHEKIYCFYNDVCRCFSSTFFFFLHFILNRYLQVNLVMQVPMYKSLGWKSFNSFFQSK